jgi:hypothetical protein
MKWIIGPKKDQVGTGKKDFCFTNPGEILTAWGMKCTRGFPEDRCGCCRAFSGLKSRSGTTIGVVGEVRKPIKSIILEDLEAFLGRKPDNIDKEWLSARILECTRISQELEKLPIGQRVGVKFLPDEELEFRAKIFIAGSDNKEFGV